MKIAVDVMGGDHAPQEIIPGAVKWAEETTSNVILVGRESEILKELDHLNYDPSRVEIINADEVIGMEESPAAALRKKKDASIVVATKLVKEKKADAILSCGNTGAQMAAAIFILGRMEGIDRPPVIGALPNLSGSLTFLVDIGANVDCKPRQLLQFAVLGNAYARLSAGLKSPRVGLLSNGSEAAKGNQATVEVHNLLQEHEGINFIGNIEGRDILGSMADIIVCDGFIGNIILKTIEGMALFLARGIQEETGHIPELFKKLDYTQVGGAPLLGIEGISIVCHGSSKREAVYNGMCIAEKSVNEKIVEAQKMALISIINNQQ